jgi:hypothetical protein
VPCIGVVTTGIGVEALGASVDDGGVETAADASVDAGVLVGPGTLRVRGVVVVSAQGAAAPGGGTKAAE